MSVIHIMQPNESKLCGQSCVAMYCGISLHDSIETFKTRSGTSTRQLIVAMQNQGIEIEYSPLKLITKWTALPETCIIKITWHGRKNNGHWIFKKGDSIHDPSFASPCKGVDIYKAWLAEHGKMTSYLELK